VGAWIPHGKGQFFGDMSCLIVKYRERILLLAEPIDMLFGMKTWVGQGVGPD